MICKWCGATVTAGDKSCGRCGREIPAMSDCGGFYGLASAPKAAPVAAAVPVAPPAPDPEELARRAAARKKAEQMALMRLGVFALVALIIVIMLIVIIAKTASLDKRIDVLERDVANLNSKLSAQIEDAPEKDDIQNLDKPDVPDPGEKPEKPNQDPEQLPPENAVPESWGFSVEGIDKKFTVAEDEMNPLELPVANGRTFAKNSIVFERADIAMVEISLPEEGEVRITLTGEWIKDYEQLENAWPEGEVYLTQWLFVEGKDGASDSATCCLKVSGEIYNFFGELVKQGTGCEKVCRLAIEDSESGAAMFTFAVTNPAPVEEPEVDEPVQVPEEEAPVTDTDETVEGEEETTPETEQEND